MRTLRPALALAALVLLAGCNKSDDGGRSATGEVLPGTISDDMLPTDKLTSEAPLAAPSASGDKSGAPAAEDSADTATADTGDAAAEEAPAAASSANPAPKPGE